MRGRFAFADWPFALLRSLVPDAAKGAALGAASGCGAILLGIPHVLHQSGLSILVGLALFGAVLYLTPARPAMWVAVASPSIMIAAISLTPVIRGPLQSLVRSDPVRTRPDAIVVLASGVTGDGYLDGRAVDRLFSGVELARRFAGESTPPLILTTVHADEDRRSIASTGDQRTILKLLRHDGPVVFTDAVLSTRDEAVETRQVADLNGWRHVAVVTSPAHTRRACRTFEHVGLRVTCVPSRSNDFAVRNLGASDRLLAFRDWLYETAGILNYRWNGWL